MPKQGAPKQQHYLPAVYLKQFSIDGPKAHRNSLIWRLDGALHKDVPVETQCSKAYFYSNANAADAEQFFSEIEKLYGKLAKLVWEERQNTNLKEYFGLIVFIISVHLRNPAYRVLVPGTARIDIYKLLEQQFVHQVLLRGSEMVPTQEELLEILKRNWRVKLLSAPSGELMITSDNPALWYSANETGNVHFMVLPVTPTCCAIAFDCSVVDVQGAQLTSSDVRTLNQTQQKSMLKALYSNVPFADTDQKAAQSYLRSHQAPEGFIDARDWQMNVLGYLGTLSFVQLRSR